MSSRSLYQLYEVYPVWPHERLTHGRTYATSPPALTTLAFRSSSQVSLPASGRLGTGRFRRFAPPRKGLSFGRYTGRPGLGNGDDAEGVWEMVREAASRPGIERLSPHELRRTCARLCRLAGGEFDQIQFLLGHVSIQTTERYLGCKQKLRCGVNDRIGIEPEEVQSASDAPGNRRPPLADKAGPTHLEVRLRPFKSGTSCRPVTFPQLRAPLSVLFASPWQLFTLSSGKMACRRSQVET